MLYASVFFPCPTKLKVQVNRLVRMLLQWRGSRGRGELGGFYPVGTELSEEAIRYRYRASMVACRSVRLCCAMYVVRCIKEGKLVPNCEVVPNTTALVPRLPKRWHLVDESGGRMKSSDSGREVGSQQRVRST
jgi:hypothetical protein